jgi:hypothetical protein
LSAPSSHAHWAELGRIVGVAAAGVDEVDQPVAVVVDAGCGTAAT